MRSGKFVISSDQMLEVVCRELGRRYRENGFVFVDWSTDSQRSLPANNLYWLWLGTASSQFKDMGRSATANELHLYMRHLFLGYEDVQMGNKKIEGQLRSTRSLTKGEFFHYMEQVDQWMVNEGCMLPYPDESDYAKAKKAQNQ